jgi:putative FmdB family regulatory protein
MPMYDYRCTLCGGTFEALVRLGAEAPPCPACGAVQSERSVTAPAAPATYKGVLSAARQQARREGHFSNYSRSERAKV